MVLAVGYSMGVVCHRGELDCPRAGVPIPLCPELEGSSRGMGAVPVGRRGIVAVRICRASLKDRLSRARSRNVMIAALLQVVILVSGWPLLCNQCHRWTWPLPWEVAAERSAAKLRWAPLSTSLACLTRWVLHASDRVVITAWPCPG